jgi:hypothetical protein
LHFKRSYRYINRNTQRTITMLIRRTDVHKRHIKRKYFLVKQPGYFTSGIPGCNFPMPEINRMTDILGNEDRIEME